MFLDRYNESAPTLVKKRRSTAQTPTPHPHARFKGAHSTWSKEPSRHFVGMFVSFANLVELGDEDAAASVPS